MPAQTDPSLDVLVTATRTRLRGTTKVAWDAAAREVIDEIKDLEQYVPPLRRVVGVTYYEHEVQRRMGTTSARQVVLALDGQAEKMDPVSRRTYATVLRWMLLDYIMSQVELP